MPMPARELRLRWRRLDGIGDEQLSVSVADDGIVLAGSVQTAEAGRDLRLRYRIECDAAWRTRTATVDARAGERRLDLSLACDGAGSWWRDGAPEPVLAGALDIDLGFTPATNTLPIRRLSLAVGAAADVRTAWLRFPELRLETLEQTYERVAERTYRYRALVDGEPFAARLDTDADGWVVRYEGLWEAVR